MSLIDSRPVRFGLAGGLARYLAAVRGFEKNVHLILSVTALRGMVVATMSTILNLYLYSLGYDARFIGIINAANSLAVLLVSVPAGYLADRIGRRAILLAGGVGYPLTILGITLARSTAQILVANFLCGAFACAYWVAAVPLLFASTRPDQRVHAFSINSFLLWGLGPVGAFLGGQVVEITARILHVSANSASALRAGMVFLIILAVAGALPYPFLNEGPRPTPAHDEVPPLGRLTALFTQLLIPDLILAFGLGAILTFAQLYFHLRFGLDPGPVGIILAIGGVTAGAATLFTPILARRWGNLSTAVRCQFAATPMMAVVALSTHLAISLPAYWLTLMLRGMADPVYTAFIQERVPEVYRARLTGFYSVTYSIGYSFGPALSGQLQKAGGFTPAFLMGASCYLVGATLLWLFFARRQGQTAAAPYT